MNRIFITIALFVLIASCETDDPGPVTGDGDKMPFSREGIFVVNEGNFTRGNGSISFYSFGSAKVYNQVFMTANKRKPGDVPFSMSVSADTGYLLVNNSGKIEMVDIWSMVSLKTLSGLNSPRYLCHLKGNKAYVSSLYSDMLTIIDTRSLTVTGEINLGTSSEMMVPVGTKVYVASWSGNKRIIVIDSEHDVILKNIGVVMEPESMVVDKNGLLWVLCSGGYMKNEIPALLAIDTRTDSTLFGIRFPLKSYPTSLSINKTGDTLYYIDNAVFRMSVDDRILPSSAFIEAVNGRMYYRVYAGASDNEIFITDANDYQHNGYLLRYTASGVLVDTEETGLIPGRMLHVKKK